jgi:hypothetical protein
MADKKVNMVCKICGSEDVRRDAWAEWNTDKQQWVLREVCEVYNFGHCNACDGECSITEVPVT